MMSNQALKQLTEAVDKLLANRFCSNCQKYKPYETGSLKPTMKGNRLRWKCQQCITKKYAEV